MTDSIGWAFAALLLVAGPWKVSVAFAEMVKEAEPPVRRAVALRTVGIATALGIGLLAFGFVLVKLFKVDAAGLLIGAGLIIVVWSIWAVVGPHHPGSVESTAPGEFLHLAVFPLAVPILISPAAVATLTAVGIDTGLSDLQAYGIAIAFLVVMVIDLGVLLLVARDGHRLAPEAWEVLGRLFGVFLTAYGVSLIVDGVRLLSS